MIATLLAIAALGGCSGDSNGTGGGDKSAAGKKQGDEKGDGGKGDGGKGGGGEEPAPTPNPLGPPPQHEDIAAAQERIAAALESDDCEEINELNPVSRPNLNTAKRCDYLKRLKGLPVSASAEYGGLAGVIDYTQGKRILNAVLIRDTDGLYHIAYVDKFANAKDVGTEFPEKAFDEAAEKAVNALADGDCDAFKEVAFVEFGRGSRPDKELCPRVEANPVASRLERLPEAKPKAIGGNAVFGFYELDTPKTFFTLVLRHQTPSDHLPKGEELPENAAEYAYVDAYRTNERKPPETSSGP